MDRAISFHQVVIEEGALGTPLAERVRRKLPDAAFELIPDVADPAFLNQGADRDPFRPVRDSFGEQKKRLIIAREKRGFLRQCPGTPGMLCCNLHVLDLVVGCPYDCSFCFLQSYQNLPGIVVYADYMNAVAEIGEALRSRVGDRSCSAGPLMRVCTGELGDSLALEPLLGTGAELVRAFSRLRGAVLELKTKSANLDNLLELDHGGNTVISWSISPADVARREERGAPSVEERLIAAEQAVAAGYGVAFHLDPVFLVPQWESLYVDLIDELFRRIPGEAVRWFSLGGFRYAPSFKGIARARQPETRIFLDEFVPCRDGKYRYFSSLRVAMYRTLKNAIESRAAAVPVYLCMEAAHVWRKVYGGLPSGDGRLGPLFRRHCS